MKWQTIKKRNIAVSTIFFIHPSRRSSIKHNLKTTACAHTFSLRFFSASPWQKNFFLRFKVLTELQTTCHFCCSTRDRFTLSLRSCHSFLLFLYVLVWHERLCAWFWTFLLAGTDCNTQSELTALSTEHTAAYIRNLVISTNGASGELFGVMFHFISTQSAASAICFRLRVRFRVGFVSGLR